MHHADGVSSPVRPQARGRAIALTRVVDVVLDPAAAFRDIDATPTWGIAFVATVALRFGSVLAFYNPETTPGKLLAGIFFQLVTTFPLVAVTVTLLWSVALAWRVRMTWASAWCVTTHVTFAYTLLTVAIASVAGALLPDGVQVELRQPPFTNLGALASASESPVWHTLLAAADVRSLYAAALAWVAVRSASRTTGRTAAAVVWTCFAITAAAAVASAALR